MTLVLQDIILRMSLELLRDVTELQVDVQHEHNKQLSKSLDTLAHSLANMIEVLNEKD